MHSNGIYKADVIMLTMEDGDRTQALLDMGKKVIALDINPLSKTAKTADITIVDNVIRVMPTMIDTITALKREKDIDHLQNIIDEFDNRRNLANSLKVILDGLEKQSNSE